MTNPIPVDLTSALIDELEARADAGEQPAAYVLRDGQPTWVTVSCERVIANIQPELVESCEGGWRVASFS